MKGKRKMMYDRSMNRLDNAARQIHCAILVKPQKSQKDWPAGEERAIVGCLVSSELGYANAVKKVSAFAKKYISNSNKHWHEDMHFSGILFSFPNGMTKRYEIKD